MHKLIVSFGGEHPAKITSVDELSWSELVNRLSQEPPVAEDKAANGWFIPAEFKPPYRESENLVARHALTLDYDALTKTDVGLIQAAYKPYSYLIYTTANHTAKKPRIRVVMPLNRGATADEFQAVSRMIALQAGIELAARESHVATQMSYLPTVKPGMTFQHSVNEGAPVSVEDTLARYTDWRDRLSWPHRKEGDNLSASGKALIQPEDKPGVVGLFCRTFNVYQAIEHFELPYLPTSNPDRWTYTHGSRAEGVIIYDDGRKLHSHHDTDPGRGQNNAFDLVRLHLFHELDKDCAPETPMADRPSFKAMVQRTLDEPQIRRQQAASAFDPLPPRDELEMAEDRAIRSRNVGVGATFNPIVLSNAGNGSKTSRDLVLAQQVHLERINELPEYDGKEGLAKHVSVVLSCPTSPRWLIKDVIERGVIAVMAGPRGSYKSFLALDWACKTALSGLPAYIISAEGNDMDRRAKAWLMTYAEGVDVKRIPLFIVEKRLNLANYEGIKTIRDDCQALEIEPALFVLDTFSKLSGGLDENDNTAVKQFIGFLDNGLKRADTAFDATVLLVAHTGHSDKGRPRGASALGADTDAEYVVSRSDTASSMSVTRERFKSSPELSSLYYKTQSVSLDYVGEDGAPITSLILQPTDAYRQRTKAEPTGSVAKIVYEFAKKFLSGGQTVSIAKFTNNAIECLPKSDDTQGRDRRRGSVQRALDSLVANSFLFLPTSDSVSLSTAKFIASETWDDSKEERDD